MEKFGLGYLVFSLSYLYLFYFISKKNEQYRKFVLAGFVIIQMIYLSWRLIYTIPSGSISERIAGSLLYLAEFMGFVQAFTLVFLFWTPYKRKEKTLDALEKLPTVDILVATYNENIEILERTVVGCLSIDYPKERLNIYLCDDGNRSIVKKLAEKHHIGFIARPTHEHAKAGNLNYALTQTSGQIIVTQDADMVPKREFLQRTLGYFSDKKVGFIQTPQTFFNSDIFQHNLYLDSEINNEQDFFMRSLEEGKDRFNAVLYVGSNALFQREALESIGGFTTGVITEDMATGLLLQNNGWQGVFVNETLASGLSPETLGDYVKQRDRWGRGNVQVIKKYTLQKLKNLSFIQKWFYLDGVMYWYSGMYKLIYLMSPFLYLVFDIASLKTTLTQLIVFWLPAFLSGSLMYKTVARKKYNSFISNIYELVTAPQVSWAVWKETLFSPKKNKKFHVTIKGVQGSKGYFDWRNCKMQILLLCINLFTLFYYIFHLDFQHLQWQSILSINLYWLIYNIVSLVVAVSVAYERPRLPMSIPVDHQGEMIKDEQIIPVQINYLGERSVIITVEQNDPYLSQLLNQEEGLLSFEKIKEVKMVRSRILNLDGKVEITFKIQKLSRKNHYLWLGLIYSDAEHIGDIQSIRVKFYTLFKYIFKNKKDAQKNQQLLL
ncbi:MULTISPECIES: glycosyltransferase [unclassified Enterococcus]|uniref:glycosyltransferase family 2 protein n=1 Tax=unclassified Enterococcus TaxID=2608891 RepID=UPI001CE1C258|nr:MULTISPECIES: cellulose synthase catalytic subunit [unclassified Enterococcus]MCA5012286.1 glycosyltransferase [Enterococcus sp. S23]MCA5015537.1 glycosyltransferase [Enterococcus sp. S22(2020)]